MHGLFLCLVTCEKSLDTCEGTLFDTRNIASRGSPLVRLRGNPVKIRSGPAAVIGDETRERHWPTGREGPGSRTIREPEDLPLLGFTQLPRVWEGEDRVA